MRIRANVWVVETEKQVRLWVVAVRDKTVLMSYRSGDPIAVTSSVGDFKRYFELEAPSR